MIPVKIKVVAFIVAMISLSLPSAAVGSACSALEKPAECSTAPSEKWDDWPRKNLKEDWNYIFHTDRINQWHAGEGPKSPEEAEK